MKKGTHTMEAQMDFARNLKKHLALKALNEEKELSYPLAFALSEVPAIIEQLEAEIADLKKFQETKNISFLRRTKVGYAKIREAFVEML